MRIAAGSDHAGLELKRALVAYLQGKGLTVDDLGTHDASSTDYPDWGERVARAVAAGEATLGLLVCGSGQGMAMAANRVPGVRAAVVADSFSSRAARAHNDANVLCLGQRVVGVGVAQDIVDAFLSTPFEGGRHAQRVAKLTALETRSPS
jgi:ribose 5-phosphate isomerase B